MSSDTKPGMPELRSALGRGRGLLFWAFVFSIFVNILMLTGPLYMLQVYDRVLASRSVETLVALSLLVASLYLLMGMLDYARGRVMARIGAKFQSALEQRLFEATLRRAIGRDQEAKSAAAIRDLEIVQRFFASPVLLAVFDMPWVPVFMIAIFLFHPMLGWVAVCGGGVIVLFAIANQLLTHKRTREAQEDTQRARHFADLSRRGNEIVLSQGMGRAMLGRYIRLRTGALENSLRATDMTGSFSSATKTFRMFLQSAMLGAGAYFVIQGEMTPGSMIAGAILLGRGLAPIEQAMGGWPLLQQARSGWVSLAEYLERTPEIATRTKLPVPKAHLVVSGATVLPPGSRVPTLRNVSFKLEPGQALGVIGRSGAGKSTLARMLAGYWTPATGSVRLDGATLDQYDPDDLGRYVGYLPQMVTLFPGTISENIARMASPPDSAAVIAAAKKAGAHQMILGLPDGYDTYLAGNENQLSGGQRQRIALARALYGDPVLLLLDEPNSMLDSEGAEALNQTVQRMKNAGGAVVLMTHRPAAIAQCEMLLVMENGGIRAVGPRDEVMAQTLTNVDVLKQSLKKVPS